jgi:hypothetical protein
MSLTVPRHEILDSKLGDSIPGDLYLIADRIHEFDSSLYVAYHEDHVEKGQYVVMEQCADGVDRFVTRVKQLDARIIEKLRYMQSVPFEKRFAEAERCEAKADAELKEHRLDEAYEALGAPMLPLLQRTGGIDSRPQSYPKLGVTGGKGSKAKS